MFAGILRHWEVAKEAYLQEKEQMTKRLPIHQKDFLPAALEIMEKPASPAGRTMLWLIIVFFIIALLWALIGKIDVVASSPGKIVPHGQTKVIQSIESGIVREIFVENGKSVAKGDLLIELDATFSAADVERLKRELESALVTEVRNRWLLANLHDKKSNNELLKINFPEAISIDVTEVQTMLAHTQLNEYNAIQSAYQQQLYERQTEKKVIKSSLEKINETLPLLMEQVEGFTKLSEKGAVPRFQFLEYQERLINHQKDITIETDRMEQVDAAIQAINKQREQHQQEFRKQVVSELAQATDTIVAARQELTKAEKTNTLQNIRSPVNGVVQQLAINTIGGVIAAGDPLMVVVPADMQLQVEATILNKDIGFVEIGDAVEIKLEPFPFTKYGVVHGEIISIDRDALQDEALGLVYPARISLSASAINVNGNDISITPGMALTAEVKIGKRRIIEFILSPLLRYKNESLRER